MFTLSLLHLTQWQPSIHLFTKKNKSHPLIFSLFIIIISKKKRKVKLLKKRKNKRKSKSIWAVRQCRQSYVTSGNHVVRLMHVAENHGKVGPHTLLANPNRMILSWNYPSGLQLAPTDVAIVLFLLYFAVAVGSVKVKAMGAHLRRHLTN